MYIAMIGTGYVGLVSAACFAEFGIEVTAVDNDRAKIDCLQAGNIPIYEPQLDEVVTRNVAAGRLKFTTDLSGALEDVDAVFIAVGTPSRRGDGHADLTYLFAAAEEIAGGLTGDTVVVTKSTVPVGTCRRLQQLFAQLRPDLQIEVASNPEFLREGSAIEDFLRPDRVVVGVETEHARQLLERIYRPLNLIQTPILITSLETAELVKYATNSFLATKVTFINEMADLCERVGADVQSLAKGLGLDRRIGGKFLHPGPGYGGSCFPKDTSALLRIAEEANVPMRIVESVVAVNEGRKRNMVRKIVQACGGTVRGQTLAVLGVTFKPNTDDVRDSPSLVIVPALQGEGAAIRAHDPEGMTAAAGLLPGVTWCDDAYAAMEGADAVVILTEWNEFRTLDLERARSLLRRPTVVDLRNVYDPGEMMGAGFSYTSIGRPVVTTLVEAREGNRMSASGAMLTGATSHAFHPTILREYDIRGIVGETLMAADAFALGRAYATLVGRRGGRRIALGRDGRLSSPELAAALAQGLVAGGAEVLEIGLGPTPMLYFAVHHLGADGGIQVTGSHNPPSHNGFKMMLGTKPLFGGTIQELGRIAAEGAFASGQGRHVQQPVFDAYVDRLLHDYAGTRELKVVWDAGNGATGEVLQALAARLPGRHELLFAEIDGRFPNHHPDPTVPANLEDLIRAARAGGAELGIAFDGDGDRIGLVDGQGRILFGDQLLQILAEEVLGRHPGAPIIADVKASQALFDEIARLGGRPVMWKTGHSLIKSAMAEMQAPLAGEMSGHIFYADGFYGHDDALYVAVRLLAILARGDETLAQRRDRMAPMINTPELRFDCPDEVKFAVVEQVKTRLAADGAEVNGIDGVRVMTADGWWLLRASNTQAVLVARAEAHDDAGLARLKEQIAANLRAVGVEPPAF